MPARKLPEEFWTNLEDQECVLPQEELDARRRGWGSTIYDPRYNEIAYDILSEGKSKAHVAVGLSCSEPTITTWMKTYPKFNEAIQTGLTAGKSEWLDKVNDHSYMPAKTVNNGLIKLLSAHLYNIQEEAPQTIIINNPDSKTAEEQMNERGIPLPDMGCDDLPEDE